MFKGLTTCLSPICWKSFQRVVLVVEINVLLFMCLLTLLNVWTHVNLQVVFRLMGSIMWWCGSYVYVWKNSFMLALGHKMIIQMPFWVVMDRLSFLTFKWLTSLSFLYFHLLQFWRDQEMLRQLYWSLQLVWKVCFVFSCRPCCFEVIYILKTLCSRGVHNFHNLIVFLKCVLILFFLPIFLSSF